MSLVRTRPVNPIRAALEQAAAGPRMQQAAALFVSALVDEAEAVLRSRYGGETLRTYIGKGGGQAERDARTRRVLAALAGGEPAALVADREQLSLRRVQQLAQQAKQNAKSSA